MIRMNPSLQQTKSVQRWNNTCLWLLWPARTCTSGARCRYDRWDLWWTVLTHRWSLHNILCLLICLLNGRRKFYWLCKIHAAAQAMGCRQWHLLRASMYHGWSGWRDGGQGGNIYAWVIVSYGPCCIWRYKKHVFAGDGESGAKSNRTGANGADQIIEASLGTVIRDVETDEIIAEITQHGEIKPYYEVAGAVGGNAFFKSSTHQTHGLPNLVNLG